MNFITTGRKTNNDCVARAMQLANTHNMTFIHRCGKSLELLQKENNCSALAVVRKNSVNIADETGEVFFHPSMAQVRIKRLRKKGHDNMLEAMDLQEGMTVLDCTLGLASDALVSAFKSHAAVVGLEANPLLALMTEEGLKNYPFSSEKIASAAKNIKVINAKYEDYLKATPDKSYDVVYFDPMFRHPLTDSSNINPLRVLADTDALTKESIAQAVRVARHRIVMKETSQSHEFSRLGFPEIGGGKYSPIHYGIIKIA